MDVAAALNISADSSNLVKATKDLDAFTAASDRAGKASDVLSGSTKRMFDMVQRIERQLATMSATLKAIERGMGGMSSATRSAVEAQERASTAINRTTAAAASQAPALERAAQGAVGLAAGMESVAASAVKAEKSTAAVGTVAAQVSPMAERMAEAARRIAEAEDLAAVAGIKLSHAQMVAVGSGRASAAQMIKQVQAANDLNGNLKKVAAATLQADAHVLAYRANLAASSTVMQQADAHVIAYRESLKTATAAGTAMSGALRLAAGVMGGVLGVAIATGVGELITYVAKLWEVGEAAKDTEKRLYNLANAAARAAHAAEANQKIEERAKLLEERTLRAGRTPQGQAFFERTERARQIDREVAALDKVIAGYMRRVELSNQLEASANRQGALNDRIAASTDKVAAATQSYNKAIEAANAARLAGRISDEEYVQEGIRLQKQLNAVKDADKLAAAAKRDHSKEARDAAKAARELAAAQRELQSSFDALQREYDPAGAARAEYERRLKDLNQQFAAKMIDQATLDNWAAQAARKLRDALGQIPAFEFPLPTIDIEKWQRDMQDLVDEDARRADRKLRETFRTAAYDFADIVGSKFGDSIADMANVIDRFAPELGAELGKFLLDLNDKLGGLLAYAGIGGSAAKATGGSGIGGMVGGAIGGELGKEFLTDVLGKKLGSLAGPIGAIAGGILGGVVGGLFSKVKKASATIEIMAGDAAMASLTGNSSKLKATASAMADSLIGGLSNIADQLGGMLGDGIRISIGQRKNTFRVDAAGLGRTKNMPKFDTEAEAVQYALQQAIMQGAITGLRAGTETLIKAQGDLETQLAKALKFENVFKELEQRANPARASIDAVTREMSELIGIFEEASATAEDYARLMELMALKQAEVIEQAFAPIRTLLDELTSKADEAADAVRSAYQSLADKAAEAAAAYQAAIEEQRRAEIQARADVIRESMSALKTEMKTFTDAAEKLREFAAGIFASANDNAVRFSAAAVRSAAQAGDVSRLQSLRDAAEATSGDRLTMMRRLALIQSEANKAASGFDTQASAVEKQIAAAEKQVIALDALQQTSVSIETLLRDMETAEAAAEAARMQMDLLGIQMEREVDFYQTVADYEKATAERDNLQASITQAGFADLIAVQQQTGAQMVAALVEVGRMAAEAQASASSAIAAAQAATRIANDNAPWMLGGIDLRNLPMFASGGLHSGGLRIVGESGAEIEATGPSRIWNAEQIAAALGGGGGVREEVAALREDMSLLLGSINRHTFDSAKIAKRWDGDGVPPERDVA